MGTAGGKPCQFAVANENKLHVKQWLDANKQGDSMTNFNFNVSYEKTFELMTGPNFSSQ